jgi:hypothetical protein
LLRVDDESVMGSSGSEGVRPKSVYLIVYGNWLAVFVIFFVLEVLQGITVVLSAACGGLAV